MFSKGQKVTVINLWSDGRKRFPEITFSYDQATVYSCGKKRMILENGVGYKGQNFLPQIEQYGSCKVFPEMTDEEAVVMADKLAMEYCEAQIARLEEIIASGKGGERYQELQQQDLDSYKSFPVLPSKPRQELKDRLMKTLEERKG